MLSLREFVKRYDPLSRRAGYHPPMADGKPEADTSRRAWPRMVVAGTLVVASAGIAGMLVSHFLPVSTLRAGAPAPEGSTFTAANVNPASPDDAVSTTSNHGATQHKLATPDESFLPFNEVSGEWFLASVGGEETSRTLASTPEYIADLEWKEPSHLGLGMQVCNRYSLTLLQRQESHFVVESSFMTQKLCNDDRDSIENYLVDLMGAQELHVSHTTAGLTIRDSSNTHRFVHFTRHSDSE